MLPFFNADPYLEYAGPRRLAGSGRAGTPGRYSHHSSPGGAGAMLVL